MCNDLIENVHFRIPQENWHEYPVWLLLCIHEIIAPVIALSAIAMKILMKKEMNRYLFGNSVHPEKFGPSMRFHRDNNSLGSLGDNNSLGSLGDNNPLGSLGDNNPKIIITPPEN